MFQTFEPLSDRSFARKHLPLLRAELTKAGLDGFIVPHDDEYQNEYTPAYADRLMWISGFTGSAGSAIVLKERAVIFTDGRYTLQVRQQTDDTCFEFEDVATTSPAKWLENNGQKATKIGYDPILHTSANLEHLQRSAAKAGFELVPTHQNPIDAAWHDQPPRPKTQAIPHPIEYAGRTSDDKRAAIGKALTKANVDHALITSPASVAWLFNIRGGDVARTPVPLARATISASGEATLFIDPDKVDNQLPAFLGDAVQLQSEDQLLEALRALGSRGATVAIDDAATPVAYKTALEDAGATINVMTDPCALPRATKNDVEVAGARAAHIRDGAAVTEFLHWLDTEGQTGDIDEIGAASRLEEFRRQHHDLRDLSFDSISGAGANGAICHYRVTTETNAKLAVGSLYLVDSGGQYPDGTTDITRTAPIGAPSDEMRDRFTRVLQGHIALATARFPTGTTGSQIDALARRPLWNIGVDYDHGTGHGVGSFLGVHEGPQRIAKAGNTQALLPGMILSNEPGFYKAGAYGIRIENLVIVQKAPALPSSDRDMLEFETITIAPIHLDLVDPTILSADERDWLNTYHKRVRETLTPLVPAAVQSWLAEATRAI